MGHACRQYYAEKKSALEKRARTLAANTKAVKHTEARTAEQLAVAEATSVIHARRRVHWFERFVWFVTSEGYLVLAGRDAQQAELLVTRCAASYPGLLSRRGMR
jgi:predicted ribosome quality control (RQC) complex YloA/Tae2 family protein